MIPFLRYGQKLYSKESSHMIETNNRLTSQKINPCCTLVFNFTPPSQQQPLCLLSFHDLNILFKQVSLSHC